MKPVGCFICIPCNPFNPFPTLQESYLPNETIADLSYTTMDNPTVIRFLARRAPNGASDKIHALYKRHRCFYGVWDNPDRQPMLNMSAQHYLRKLNVHMAKPCRGDVIIMRARGTLMTPHEAQSLLTILQMADNRGHYRPPDTQ